MSVIVVCVAIFPTLVIGYPARPKNTDGQGDLSRADQGGVREISLLISGREMVLP